MNPDDNNILTALKRLAEAGTVTLDVIPWACGLYYIVGQHCKTIGADSDLNKALAAALATLYGKE